MACASVLVAGCASQKVEGIRVPLNTRTINPITDSVPETEATVRGDSIVAVVVPAEVVDPTPTRSPSPSGSSTSPARTGGTGAGTGVTTETATNATPLKTNGIYDCGTYPTAPLLTLFLRFNENGEFFLSSGTEDLDATRPWLGIDTTRVPAGSYSAFGSVVVADSDPGVDPGVRVTGQFTDGGMLSVHTKNEATRLEHDYVCTFSPDPAG